MQNLYAKYVNEKTLKTKYSDPQSKIILNQVLRKFQSTLITSKTKFRIFIFNLQRKYLDANKMFASK